MIYRLMYAFLVLMSRIPYSMGQAAGRLIGAFFFLIPMSRRDAALDNIVQSFDGRWSREDCRTLLRRVYGHFGQMLFEVPHILRLNPERLGRYVVFENEDYLLDALAEDRGIFILTAHFGNWEMMSAAIGIRFGVEGAVIVRPMDFEPLNRLMSVIRTRFGTEMIPKQKAMRRVIGALRRRKTVGILLDQNVDWYDGVFVRFLGRWACTNKGLALLAAKTGAPVVPAFCVRQGDGRHRIIFEKKIPMVSTGHRDADVDENTTLFTNMIETYVRKYPELWFWFHRRWKTRNYCVLHD